MSETDQSETDRSELSPSPNIPTESPKIPRRQLLGSLKQLLTAKRIAIGTGIAIGRMAANATNREHEPSPGESLIGSFDSILKELSSLPGTEPERPKLYETDERRAFTLGETTYTLDKTASGLSQKIHRPGNINTYRGSGRILEIKVVPEDQKTVPGFSRKGIRFTEYSLNSAKDIGETQRKPDSDYHHKKLNEDDMKNLKLQLEESFADWKKEKASISPVTA